MDLLRLSHISIPCHKGEQVFGLYLNEPKLCTKVSVVVEVLIRHKLNFSISIFVHI